MKFIDIHGHYAWGIDDGIENIEDCKEALNVAKKNGIEIIVATPHLVGGRHDKNDIVIFKNRIAELKQMASNYDIQVIEGCELFLNDGYYRMIKNKDIIPFENTNYLLCEFDVRRNIGSEDEVEEYLYEISAAGYTPIVAHVERYFHKKMDLKRVRSWVEEGYVIQVNTSSILGTHGSTVEKNAMSLIENGLCHVVATDTHRPSKRRYPNMLETYELLEKKIGKDSAEFLCYHNPKRIINNQEVDTIEVKTSFFKKLFGGK